MFNPSKDDVRRFFCEAWAKHRRGGVLTPLEAVAVDWIERHPEYHPDLADADAAVGRDYSIDDGRTNPFLHLSLHLAIRVPARDVATLVTDVLALGEGDLDLCSAVLEVHRQRDQGQPLLVDP